MLTVNDPSRTYVHTYISAYSEIYLRFFLTDVATSHINGLFIEVHVNPKLVIEKYYKLRLLSAYVILGMFTS